MMIDLWKIICNAIIAFCTAFLATYVVGQTESSIPFIVALITAVLAAALELKKEVLPPKEPNSSSTDSGAAKNILVIPT